MSCAAVAKLLLLDDNTIRIWHRLYEEDEIEGLASFGYEVSACRLKVQRRLAKVLAEHAAERMMILIAFRGMG